MPTKLEYVPSQADLQSDEDPSARVPTLEAKNAVLEETNRQLRLDIRRLEQLVYIDPLTGLGNRRFFDASIAAELRRAARERRPLTLLICDIDRFKQCNDRHGHMVGDSVLIEVARILQACCRRGGDLAIRYAGDEFALLLPDVQYDAARQLTDKVSSGMSESAALRRLDEPVTLSIGGAVFKGLENCEPSQFVEGADRALYRVKRSGRNRAELIHFG